MSASYFLPTLETETRLNNLTSDVPTASNSSDPASSLRAAALLTLKSKRRKPLVDSSQALPSRPPPPSDTGFQLDYGQEDITPSPVPVLSETPNIPPKPPVSKPTEDDQTREEGEISDEEVFQPSANLSIPNSPKQLPLPPIVTNLELSKRLTPSRSSDPSLAELSLAKPKLSDRISDPPSSAFADDTAMAIDSPLVDDFPLHLIDVDHVRPGLALNQSQYDTAKDIVLDLLGWGVPPEYLVDCGLTREIVFYVFSELHLRLPQNLDITGLLSYPPEVKSSVERHQSASMPPPGHTANHILQSHPSPATKPLLPQSPPPTSQDLVITTPSTYKAVPEATHVSSLSNLHDIEQQRRQELLARKAAIASRKSKVAASTEALANPRAASPKSFEPHSVNGHDVDMTVPTETVDDFLKSIEPKPESSPTLGQLGSVDAHTQRQVNGDTMDIDEIPGLGSSQSLRLSPDAISDERGVSDASEHTVASPALSATNSVSQFEYPPSSTESTKTTFDASYPTVDASYLAENQTLQQRRGTKRPVASDFVDLETAPHSHNGLNGGYSNGAVPTNSFGRYAFGNGFASVSGMRRCVIDLSDSEGEDGEDVVMGDVGGSNGKWGIRSGFVSPAPTRPAMIALSSSSRWTPPPVATVTPGLSIAPSISSGTMSPAALMEKEIEIRKMRELIAQREQSRLRKVTAARSIATMDNKGTSSSPNDITTVLRKPEDPESIHPSPKVNENSEGTNNERQCSPPAEQVANVLQQASRFGSPSSSGTATIDTHNGDNISVEGAISVDELVLSADVRHEQVVNKFSAQADVKPQSGKESPSIGPVDVDPVSSSSAQVRPKTTSAHQKQDENQGPSAASSTAPLEDQHKQDYAAYDSPFRWYPLLGSRSRQLFSDDVTSPQASSLSSLAFSSLSSLTSFTSDSSMFSIHSSSSSASPFLYSPSTHSPHSSAFPVPNLKPLKLAMLLKEVDPLKRICQYEVPGGGVCRDEGCDDVHLDRIGLVAREMEPSDQDTSSYLVNTLPATWLDEHGVSYSKVFLALQQVRLKNPQMALEERVAQALATLGPPPPPNPTSK